MKKHKDLGYRNHKMFVDCTTHHPVGDPLQMMLTDGGDGKWWQVNFWKSGTRSSWNAWNLWLSDHTNCTLCPPLFANSLVHRYRHLGDFCMLWSQKETLQGFVSKDCNTSNSSNRPTSRTWFVFGTIWQAHDSAILVRIVSLLYHSFVKPDSWFDDKFEFTLFTLLTSSRHLLTSLHTFLYQRTPSFKTQRNQAGEKLCKLEPPWISYK